MENEVVVYQSKIKQVALALLGMLMMLLSLGILLGGLSEMSFLFILIGLIGFGFFGLCEIAILKPFKRIIDKKRVDPMVRS